jgi:cytochrome c2
MNRETVPGSYARNGSSSFAIAAPCERVPSGAVHQYDPKYHDVIARCDRQMGQYGHTMIKACADQDIAAEKALSQYH